MSRKDTRKGCRCDCPCGRKQARQGLARAGQRCTPCHNNQCAKPKKKGASRAKASR